ncbi:MAG: hypothetical protein GXN93_04595 [Candidatus Diapherotrites archaeon]|nr:hypothetical protein [Candidatus Diapherotrites archaeon]
MQRRIDRYVIDLKHERRRLARLLPEDPNSLRFHGTSSRNLPQINRYRAVLAPNDLRRRNAFFIRTSRGRYDVPKSKDIRDSTVSITSDLMTALRYARDDRAESFWKQVEDLESNHWLLRFQLSDPIWPNTHAYSQWQEFLNALRPGFHRYVSIPHYPVIVAVPAFDAPHIESVDSKARAEQGEQVLVQIPAHKAIFFVPAKNLWHAKKLAPRIAHRVFPLELLVEYLERNGKRVWG